MIMKLSRTLTVAVIVVDSLLILWLISAVSIDGSHAGVMPNVQAQDAGNTLDDSFEQARSRVCTLGTMRGTHGYSYSGTVMGFTITAAGPITFNGQGNLSATYNVNLDGTPFQGAFTGTYTVNADCTGTVALHLPLLGITTNGSFVIVNSGKETFFTGTDPGIAITGVTKKL
jgi:hypothetical protein